MGVDSEMMGTVHFHNDLVIFDQDISREEAIIGDALNVVRHSQAAHHL